MFDNILNSVSNLGNLTSLLGDKANLIQMAQKLMEDQGGLQGLVSSFQQNGLSDTVASWIGTGSNLGVSPEQIQQVFGNEKIASLASNFGIDPQQASSQIAEFLPTVIDKISPNGQLPESFDLSSLTSIAGSFFK
jgi:uncharacterized protein YidB (DUF937 family)